MKRRFYLFIALIAAIALFSFSVTGCGDNGNSNNSGGTTDNSLFIIKSPYEGVNWSAFGQYKAALHTHTTNSDGSATLDSAVTAHYQQGYDILATTDHVWKRTGNTELYLDFITTDYLQTSYNGAALEALTQARIDALSAGEGRENRPMLLVPYSAELAIGGDPTPDEANVFFWGEGKSTMPAVPRAWQRNLDAGLQDAHNSGAIFFINHPGRSTNAQNFRQDGPGDASNPSNMNTWIRRYANLYMKYPSNTLVGLEIFNRRDQDSRHDRVLWDNILKQTVPNDRFVWGYANDDSHSNGGIGINYNMMVMSSNSLENFRAAMIAGHSYMVTCAAFNEGVWTGGNTTATAQITPASGHPRISSITVNHETDSITIQSTNTVKIVWISEGKEIFTDENSSWTASGASSTINLAADGIKEDVGSYIRANIIGPAGTGMAVIQPIGTKRK